MYSVMVASCQDMPPNASMSWSPMSTDHLDNCTISPLSCGTRGIDLPHPCAFRGDGAVLGTNGVPCGEDLGTQQAEEVKPVILHRQKRMWILGTINIVEEDEGPFPKFAVRINNDKATEGNIKYRLIGNGVDKPPEIGLFYLNESSRSIMVNHKIDREKTPIFKLNVQALDKNTLKEIDQALKYVIKVKDINDHAPIFNQSVYKVNVPENIDGKEFFRVTATDADEKNNHNSLISYMLISQKPSEIGNQFHINNETGAINFTGCMDAEKVQSYTLIVKAKDNGKKSLSSTGTVQINVMDANNNLPTFIRTGDFSAKVEENDEHVVMLRVSVTDKDTPNTPTWRAKYTIIEGNEHGHYKIETDPETNDGILSLVKHLDYEGGPNRKLKISVENEEPFFTCSKMIDEQKADSVSVVVTVHDTNDPPVIYPSEVTVTVVEGLKSAIELTKFNATDPDKYFKNKIRFVKAYDPEGWVTVHEETGVVTTVHELDREAPSVNENLYKVIIHAVDDGIPPQTGSCTLNILLIDINDSESHLISTYEEICDDGDTQHVTLTAEDNDMIPFGGPFHFELLGNEQNIKEKWKLDQNVGYSVKLELMKKIPIGNYTIPLNIRDRQGVATENMLHLWVCHCYDGSTCPEPKPPTAILGGVAIGLLFGALLFLLLGLCLILFMEKKRFQALPFEFFKGTLISYNQEGPCAALNKIPSNLSIRTFNSEAEGYFRNPHSDNKYKKSKGNSTLYDIDMEKIGFMQHPGNSMHYDIGMQKLGNMQYQGNSTRYDSGMEILGNILSERLNACSAWEDAQGHYQPRVYQYEGEESKITSLDRISMVESDAGFSYLDNLEEHFVTLAKICQQKKSSLNCK
uniref:cadherin-like protein 26 n=1 Tax=Pristiophorus japonicus TaxID=55135 RepID=UPI00398F1A95